MFRVHFTNFGYFADRSFASLDDAARYAKVCGFDAGIFDHDALVATWSFFGGLRLR